MKSKVMHYNWIVKISGYQKLGLSIMLSVVAFVLLLFLHLEIFTRAAIAWNIFALSMIVMSWMLFCTTKAGEQHAVVEKQDDGLKVIFTVVLISVCASLFGVVFLIARKNDSMANKDLNTVVTLLAVALSWIMLHTIFTIRYAHLYHDHNRLHTGSDVGGIEFPDKVKPDYLDFAYFSFVIGMTFQVSDVCVTSSMVRRYVLMHSLLSFMFNTIIVALTINTIADLNQ